MMILKNNISGPLSAVADLRAISNAGSVTISWSTPFSLDVTGVDPDIWYSVLIYNVTDENNPTAILCTDCVNITETHYTFTPDHPSPCHVYNFSVIPLNGAGQGESSPFISGYVLKCGFGMHICTLHVMIQSLGSVCFLFPNYNSYLLWFLLQLKSLALRLSLEV